MRYLRLLLLLTTMLLTVGCERPAPLPKEPTMAVTYAALDGAWQMTMWQGAPLAEGTYLYIEFDRTEQRYTMWDNIDSMYATDTTGSFTITEEEDGSYTLSGTYDYGVGDWDYDYRISLQNEGDTMQWWSRSTTHVMNFVRIDEMPKFN